MSSVDGKEDELFIDQMIRQLMKDQLKERSTENQNNNNSYVYLENSTLNLVILYLLMREERRTNGEVDRLSEVISVENLDQIIADIKKEFEETITLLKEKLL
jgi:hypothetical protein